MPLKRVENWDTEVLDGFFRARRTMSFAWGANDCCLFPADAIHAMTGVDIAAAFRVSGEAIAIPGVAIASYRCGNYHDKASAFALIRSVTGGSTVADAAAWCAAQYGLPERTHTLMAQRGDLVVVANGRELIAGIVHLNGRDVVSVAEEGLVRLPITAVTRAWRV